jgi:SnoaL-like protein
MSVRVATRLLGVWLAAGCGSPGPDQLSSGHRQALADSLLTLFDSLTAIHRDRPDTGLLRRLHPVSDTVLFIEGSHTEAFTGDSLFRRVVASHVPVRSMTQRFAERRALVLGRSHAVVTAEETIDWVDTMGVHQYAGLLTLTVSRRENGWVIRAYRGS